MFKLILYSMIAAPTKISLRVMEEFLVSTSFKAFNDSATPQSKFNSIRDRICTIKVAYFERIFETLFTVFNKELGQQNALSKTDSTYVALATKLLPEGMVNGTANKRYVKYSINLKGSLPSKVRVYTESKYVSEDTALGELISDTHTGTGEAVVFDRGLQSRSAFDKFSDTNQLFIARANPKTRIVKATDKELPAKPQQGATLSIKSDRMGFLLNKKEKSTRHPYRVISGIIDKSSEPICLVTNMLDEDPYLIAAWYKQRWEIEIFFKMLKQHLNMNHLVCRTENGIKVMIYMTLIVASLVIVYKKRNKISSFKQAKFRLNLQLEEEIIRTIVVLCGGNPQKAPHLFSSA